MLLGSYISIGRRWRRTEGPLAGRFEHAIGQRRGPVQAIGPNTPCSAWVHSESFQNFIILSNIFVSDPLHDKLRFRTTPDVRKCRKLILKTLFIKQCTTFLWYILYLYHMYHIVVHVWYIQLDLFYRIRSFHFQLFSSFIFFHYFRFQIIFRGLEVKKSCYFA